MSTSKYEFKREDGKLSIQRIYPKTDKIISMVEYENGKLTFKHENFDATIYGVDSIIFKTKALDSKGVTEISFEIRNDQNDFDGIKPMKLPFKFYGILSEHFIIEHTAENSDIPQYNANGFGETENDDE